MKLSLFSITAILASFVAANPILAPRAPSRSFRLEGDVRASSPYRLLTIIPAFDSNSHIYYQFGWYGTGSENIVLYFPQDEFSPGPVFDARQNGYEMVLQEVLAGEGRPSYYRPLLIDRAKTALSRLQSPSRFYTLGNFYSSPEDSNGSENPDDPDGMRWMTCITSATTDERDIEYVEELYFGRFFRSDCESGAIVVRLVVEYVSAAPVQLSADVSF